MLLCRGHPTIEFIDEARLIDAPQTGRRAEAGEDVSSKCRALFWRQPKRCLQDISPRHAPILASPPHPTKTKRTPAALSRFTAHAILAPSGARRCSVCTKSEIGTLARRRQPESGRSD